MHISKLHHTMAIFLPLFLTGSWGNAYASAPAQWPCAVWSASQSTICMRTQTPSAPVMMTPNLAIDQAMGSLKNDILIVSKPEAPAPVTMQVALRHNTPAPITSKVKNTVSPNKARQFAAVAVKPKLSRTDIVKQELQREKAALRAAENQLTQAKKTGKNVNKWERHVADRRASISAMQAELARL